MKQVPLPEEPAFVRAQRELSRHLRDPASHPSPPTLPEPRVAVYRRAVIYNIGRFMADNFPRIKAVLDSSTWDEMIRDYVIRHRATTPTFAKLPDEFLDYLRSERQVSDPPYLYELAHFDWLENVIATDERRIEPAGITLDGDLLDGAIAINPIHRIETYRFPILAIDEHHRPEAPPASPTNIVAFRDQRHQYGVLDLNAIALRLFIAVRDQPLLSARHILEEIASELKHPNPAVVVAGGLDILERMRRRGLVLGTRDRV
jgi:uncharacterized protein